MRLILIVCTSLAAGCGITGNLRGNPGYAGFELAHFGDVSRDFALSLGPIPLRMGRLIARPFLGDEPELREITRDLRAVRVYVYDALRAEPDARRRVEDTRSDLVAEGWEPIVAVREDGEFAAALVRFDERDTMRGLAVMMHDPEEIVLVNVIGRFEPSTFGTLMAGLDIETPAVSLEAPAPALARTSAGP